MLLGVFIKGFKTYSTMTFVSFVKRQDHKLTILIGQNGAGKSSVLESLDTFFNGASWNQNVMSKTGEGFVCPVFLAPKSSVSRNKAAPYISDYFWKYSTPQQTGNANFQPWEEFCRFRDNVLSEVNRNDFYLLVAGVDDRGALSYTTTHRKLKESLKPKGVNYAEHEKLFKNY